jgi:hypothetical protein
MVATTSDFDLVRKLAKGLEGIEESNERGIPALKVRGKLLAWIPLSKSADPRSLAVRLDADRRAELIAEAPEAYYVPGDCETVT